MKSTILFGIGTITLTVGFLLSDSYFPYNLPLSIIGGMFAGYNILPTFKWLKEMILEVK